MAKQTMAKETTGTTSLKLDKLTPHPANPRKDVKGANLKELAESIKKRQLVPVICRPLKKGFQILDGHRRHAAAQLAKMKEIRVEIIDVDDDEALRIVVLANMSREDLTPMEELTGLKALAEAGWTFEEIANKISKSTKWVARRMQLDNLIPAFVKAIGYSDDPRSTWALGAIELAATLTPDQQKQLMQQTRHQSYGYTRLRVSQAIARFWQSLKKAQFDVEDETLNAKRGACTACDLRSSCRKDLFETVPSDGGAGKIAKDDTCMDVECYRLKQVKTIDAKHSGAEAKYGIKLPMIDIDHRLGDKLKGTHTINQYDHPKCKKSDKGAIQCFNATTLKVEYRIGKGNSSTSGSKKARQTDSDGKVKPLTLKQRRSGLQCRRRALVIDELKDIINDLELPETIEQIDLFTLLVVFGTSESNGFSGSKVDFKFKKMDAWDMVAMLNDGESYRANDRDDLAWKMVCDVLVQRLNYHTKSDIDDKKYNEVKRLTELLGQDLAAMEIKAQDDLPEPKSWANLKADGTPKHPKPKKE